jgi:PAS domain S-box-containing protein
MAPVKRTKRILYAGDHPGAVEDAVSLLPDGETVELRAVADPQAVLEESDSGPVDCLVYEAGVELLSTLREQYPALPVLFVTDEESLAGEAVDAGATDVFVRGSAGGENRLLVHRLDNVLAHRRAARGTPATARALTVRQLSGERADSAGQLAGDTLADLLIETLDDAFYLLDTDGKLIGWNEQFRAVTGYSDDALEGMHAVELFESDDHSRIREAIETVLDTGSVSIEAAVSTAGGERIPFDWTGALLTDSDGNESGIVGIGRDISERKAREQRLELAETVFQQARDAVFLIEVSGEGRFELQRVNPAYELLAGVDAEAVQGKTPTELMGEERGSAVESRYRECVKRREAIEYEEQLSLGDQPQVWHTKLAPIVDDGEVIKLVGATRDITERTEREQRLLELRRAVETVVENVPMVLFSYDSDGVFTRSRGSALRSIGL